ncbi:hypothetical protein POTOM_048486 [Populus tomentosa]|uniref:Pentatricopeptide repeat-containing protein n=1 Tax=Populus tomentosa TaxID=118781 RepID=A0A8X7Y972_POPTO|nr:hypothetical protein POTOM_048486 [Populus tomentosa]
MPNRIILQNQVYDDSSYRFVRKLRRFPFCYQEDGSSMGSPYYSGAKTGHSSPTVSPSLLLSGPAAVFGTLNSAFVFVRMLLSLGTSLMFLFPILSFPCMMLGEGFRPMACARSDEEADDCDPSLLYSSIFPARTCSSWNQNLWVLLQSRLVVETALVDLYVKCYGMHGWGREAPNLFDQMKASVKPDYITFVSISSACRRAGKLDEACDFIERMPIGSNAAISGALLGACRIHLNVDITEIDARALFDLDPGNQGDTSSCTTLPGKREEAYTITTLMKNGGVKIIAGYTIQTLYCILWRRADKGVHMLYLHSEKLAIAFDSTISRAEHALAWIIGETCPIMSIGAGARGSMKICSKDWLLGHSPSLSSFHSAVDTDEMPSASRFFALEFNAPKKGGKAEILRANLRSTSMTQLLFQNPDATTIHNFDALLGDKPPNSIFFLLKLTTPSPHTVLVAVENCCDNLSGTNKPTEHREDLNPES